MTQDNDKILVRRLEEKIKVLTPPAIPKEFSKLQAFLVECVEEEKDFYKLKMMFQLYFGLQGETPEMMQLQQLQLNHDKKFDELKDEMKGLQEEHKRDVKWLRMGFVILLAAMVPLGLISQEVFVLLLRIFGIYI